MNGSISGAQTYGSVKWISVHSRSNSFASQVTNIQRQKHEMKSKRIMSSHGPCASRFRLESRVHVKPHFTTSQTYHHPPYSHTRYSICQLRLQLAIAISYFNASTSPLQPTAGWSACGKYSVKPLVAQHFSEFLDRQTPRTTSLVYARWHGLIRDHRTPPRGRPPASRPRLPHLATPPTRRIAILSPGEWIKGKDAL